MNGITLLGLVIVSAWIITRAIKAIEYSQLSEAQRRGRERKQLHQHSLDRLNKRGEWDVTSGWFV
jgi:hypothetical protein